MTALTVGLDVTHWYREFIYLCRLLTVAVGSGFLGLLILNGRRSWPTLSRPERYGLGAMIVYTVNVVLFTMLELATHVVPVIPNSLIYIGWLFSFVLGYTALYHSRRIR